MRRLTNEEMESLKICYKQLYTAKYSQCVSLLREEQQIVIVNVYNSLFDDDRARVGSGCIQCWARWCGRVADVYFNQLEEDAKQVHQKVGNNRKNGRG